MPLDFREFPVDLPLFLGEKRIWRYRFQGRRADPDIFSCDPLDLDRPPESLRALGPGRAAFIYSCPIRRRLPALSRSNLHWRYIDSQYRHYYLPTNSSYRDYLQSMSGKTRSTLNRKVNLVARTNPEGYFRVFDDGAGMANFYPEALRISRKSYQYRLLGQGLPDAPEFLRHISDAADQGRLLGFLLSVGDVPVAFNLCPLRNGVLLYDHTGYDPDYARCSPGTVLQMKTIEAAFRHPGVSIYDLCTGEGRHKELFTDRSILCANVYYLPGSLANLARLSVKMALDRAQHGAAAALERLGIKGKLKKLLRAHA